MKIWIFEFFWKKLENFELPFALDIRVERVKTTWTTNKAIRYELF